MLSIENASPSDRFLMIVARISEARWRDECASVRSWLNAKPSTISVETAEQMLQTINTPLACDANPMAIIHCYANVPAGTKYDVAFDPRDPDNNESTHAEVLFGVVLGRAVEMTLSHGWHQTAVLRFPTGVPQLFDQLPVDAMLSRYLCLCSQADFPDIKRALKSDA